MVITKALAVRDRDLAAFAWEQLALFQNSDYVADLIVDLHGLAKSHRDNAKRQAKQLRYCLVQAREYYEAAGAATLATKPALLYYSAMSMALAEILLKQTGDSRLERLREKQNGHGLSMTAMAPFKIDASLEDLASKLLAKPQTRGNGEQFGTFAVWLKSSREPPLCMYVSEAVQNGQQTRFAALLYGSDVPPPHLPPQGISLFDCLSRLPQMDYRLRQLGAELDLVRTQLRADRPYINSALELELIVQPTPQATLDRFAQEIVCSPAAVDRIAIIEMPSGFILRAPFDNVYPTLLHLPYSVSTDTKTAYFSPRAEFLNEFGYLLIALHICGNLARYYPDVWLAHVEHRSNLYLAIEKLMQIATERLPLLCLSELSRTWHVPEA